MNCPACNATNPDGAQWCNQCLAPLGGGAPASEGEPAANVSAPIPGITAPEALATAQQPSASYPSAGFPATGAPDAQRPSGTSNKTLIVVAAAVAVVLLGVGAFFLFGGESAKSYSDRTMDFKVTSFKCGEKSRSVIEGNQGAVAHPRNLVAKGEFCTLQVDVTSNLTSTEVEVFSAANQKLLGPSGEPIDVNSVEIETITRPNNYYQPGPDPEIEPKKVIEAKVIWDYPVESAPTAAMLHASQESSGVRVPLA
ncbi:MAG: hypothetical protein DCC49_01445 [Acidobacteria bacterium]|nr:MAG: hypothetical protein DCC49_01445 [Acidobacteriota bacterium]